MSSTNSQTATQSGGSVSAEAAAGETVTLTLTQPDSTTQTTTLATTADATVPTQGDFSGAAFTVTQDGNYSLVASVAQVGGFSAATSTPFTFTVTGITTPRTITVGTVTVA